MTAPDDVESQALWRSVMAPILARAGGLQQAEELARAALDLVRPTEAPVMKADGLCELASVQRLAGKLAEARSAIDEAIALYTAKGDTASARRCSAWAADLART
jgi:ATP/maltotriose-dependent transcriptional regulator MalT